jgi:23S rRNA (uracil1939-C5)-methyltransferase
LSKALAELNENQDLRQGWTPPRRIVYVSCNPATLARDAEILVHRAGYRCVSAGVINMFAHTAHVESMAVFELA